MINKQFEAYKLRREIKKSGTEYTFERFVKNQFGEPSEVADYVGALKGLYHEDNSHVQITTGDTTQVRTKKVPNILCVYEDAAVLGLMVGDIVKLGAKTLSVTGVVNVQEWSVVADVSLEVIDDAVYA